MALSLSLSGLSILQEKYPNAIVAKRITKPLMYDLLGGRNVHIKLILSIIVMSMSPRLTSVPTNANAIPKLKKTKRRKKGN
jgi:hypothetical protein